MEAKPEYDDIIPDGYYCAELGNFCGANFGCAFCPVRAGAEILFGVGK